jgi:fructokinase
VITVGGEALIDLVAVESTVDGQLAPLRPMPGGGPYNVAIAVGRLGAPVRFVSRLSMDGFGDALLRRLEQSGVDGSMVQRGPEPTTLAVAGIGPDGSARYSFYVEGTADRLVTDPGEGTSGLLSLGTLSLLLDPGATTYETMLRRHSGLAVVDPNIRPVLVADPEKHRARFRSWLPDIGLLKLSVEDARWLAGDIAASDVVDTVRGWLREGPAAAVITRGADGLSVITGSGELVEVPAVKAKVVDTIGAGDTVHGALLFWLHRAGIDVADRLRGVGVADWREALSFAAKAAAVTVSRAGAEPPYSHEIM